MYQCSKNEGADQLRSYHAADLHLCFAYAKSRVSHDAARIYFPAVQPTPCLEVATYRLCLASVVPNHTVMVPAVPRSTP